MEHPCFLEAARRTAAETGVALSAHTNPWSALVSGAAKACAVFESDGRAYLVVTATTPPAKPLSPLARQALEGLLCGEQQKVLASDLKLSTSSICRYCRLALAHMGLEGPPSRAPMLLAMLALAARDRCDPALVREARFEHDGRSFSVYSAAPRAPGSSARLSPGVQAVVELRVAGRSLTEIAQQRRTSERTVANQLACAFQRLGVSGRGSLVAYLAVNG
ncbi:MAG TPA: hypothetical protein VMI54_22355 [Polyangiaceae bacterium]|nr:hypothetical protein [Polyangiaceae bacterium]